MSWVYAVSVFGCNMLLINFSILLHHVLSDAILGLCFITMFKKSFRFQASLAALYLYSTNLTFPLIPALKLNVANILYSYYTPKSIGNIA